MKKNILLADGSPAVTEHLKCFLERNTKGYSVQTACNPAEAWEIMSREETNIIVFDIFLGDGWGIKFLKRIRLYFPEKRLIVLTNHSDSFFREVSLRAGADYFLDKEFEFEKLPDIFFEINNQPTITN